MLGCIDALKASITSLYIQELPNKYDGVDLTYHCFFLQGEPGPPGPYGPPGAPGIGQQGVKVKILVSLPTDDF